MGTNRGVLCLLLALALIFTLSTIMPLFPTDLGPAAAWAQEEEEPEEEEPVQTKPDPRDDGEHGFVTLLDGRSAQMVGGRLLLLEGNRKALAPDGIYRLQGGGSLTVKGGKLLSVGDDAQSGRPELPAVQSGRPEVPAIHDPRGAGQSGRPELPAVQSGRPEMPGSRVKIDDKDWDREGSMQMQSGRPASPLSGAGWDPDGRVTFKDGRQGMMQQGAGGKMQLFLLQDSSKVLAPDGTYQLQNGQQIQVQGGNLVGQMQSPGQTQMPGKLKR